MPDCETCEQQNAALTRERDEARKEVDRLRACARAAEAKACRIEWDGDVLIVTMPHASEESERQFAQAFAEIYTAFNQTFSAVAENLAQPD